MQNIKEWIDIFFQTEKIYFSILLVAVIFVFVYFSTVQNNLDFKNCYYYPHFTCIKMQVCWFSMLLKASSEVTKWVLKPYEEFQDKNTLITDLIREYNKVCPLDMLHFDSIVTDVPEKALPASRKWLAYKLQYTFNGHEPFRQIQQNLCYLEKL